jgi:hypothetical protein
MLDVILSTGASFLSNTKNSVLTRAVKPAIDQYLDGIGTVQSVEVDTDAKTARLLLDMDEEDRTVEVHLERYSIAPSKQGCCLIVLKFSSPSHPRLVARVKKFKKRIRFQLPVSYHLASSLL